MSIKNFNLQDIFRYTLLLFLFEYRSAKLLIENNFPGSTAAAISRVEVDGDVISLDGRDPVWADSEVDTNGQIRVRIRRSTSSAAESAVSSSMVMTPRHSSLSGAEIYSANTPGRPALPPHHDNTTGDVAALGFKLMSPRLSGYASSEVYSFHPTPRASNFNEVDVSTPVWAKSPAPAARTFRSAYSPTVNGAARTAWECQQPSRQRSKDIAGTEKTLSLSLYRPQK